jgi:2-methylisocitrate lyase-like PEP mutase family enzyme
VSPSAITGKRVAEQTVRAGVAGIMIEDQARH